MMGKGYQRRHLRAPYRETVLYADQGHVFKATTLNISEGGLLIDELPNFPNQETVSLLLSIPLTPSFRNFSLLKMQTFSKELFHKNVIRVKARLVRREQLAQSLDNIFRSRFGVEFIRIESRDQKLIEDYVTTYASNLVYLQTLIDSFNTDEETKSRTRILAQLLGYEITDRIAQLRSVVSNDYKSLQWL
jgi:hypothetical protein